MPHDIVGPGGARFVAFEPAVRPPIRQPAKLVAVKVPGPVVEILPASAVKVEPINWVWLGHLARGKTHLLGGAPGTGKTTIAVSICATISSGGKFPCGNLAEAGDVLIWSGEDSAEDTLVPRLLASGADLTRVHLVGGKQEGEKRHPFDPSTDMPALAKAARSLKSLRLLVLDPVVAAVAGDSHKNGETRRGLQPVVDLAAELGCAVLGITHLSKGTSGREPLERIAGSIAFGAVARVVLATVKPADPDAPRRLVRAKSNIGPDTGGFEYTLFAAPVPGHPLQAQRVDWGASLEGSARDLMSVETPDDSADSMDDAEAFLAETLREGPMMTKDIKSAAAAHGHRWRTIERAKKSLGVVATKGGFQGAWGWELPAPKTATFDDQDRHLS